MRSWVLMFGALLSCSRTGLVDDEVDAGTLSESVRDAGALDAAVDAGALEERDPTRHDGGVDAGLADAGVLVDAGTPFDAGVPFDGGPDCLGLPVDTVQVVDLPSMMTSTSLEARFGPQTRVARILVTASTVLGGRLDGGAALTVTGASTVCVEVSGTVFGTGGRGGSGGNGGSGPLGRPCGRVGGRGGPAIFLDGAGEVVVRPGGIVAGGGGGGTGFSGCNVNAGGGGGAGLPEGEGGAGATSLSMADELAFCSQDNGVRNGVPGQRGAQTAGGAGGIATNSNGLIRAGAGGGLGAAGQAPPGDCVFGVVPVAAPGAAVTGSAGLVRSARTLGNGRLLGAVE